MWLLVYIGTLVIAGCSCLTAISILTAVQTLWCARVFRLLRDNGYSFVPDWLCQWRRVPALFMATVLVLSLSSLYSDGTLYYGGYSQKWCSRAVMVAHYQWCSQS